MDLRAWEVTREIQYKTGVNCPVVPSCHRVVIQQSLQSGGCRCKPSAPALSQQTGWLIRAPWWMLTHSSDHLPRTRHQTPACTQTPEPNTQSNSSVAIRLCPRCCPLLSHSEHRTFRDGSLRLSVFGITLKHEIIHNIGTTTSSQESDNSHGQSYNHWKFGEVFKSFLRYARRQTYRHHTHPFNGPSSGTTWVSWYQKGKTNLDFTVARDSQWQWHQLGHMQICISL